MSFTPVSPSALSIELGLLPSADGLPAWAGVARIIRAASGRWGACRRLDLKRHAEELCEAAGFAREPASARVDEVLDLLVELRELEEASVAAPSPDDLDQGLDGLDEVGAVAARAARAPAAGRYLVPALPRLVCCGETGFLLGPTDQLIPNVGRAQAEEGPASVVRWARVDELPVDLRAEHGVGLWSLGDWLGAPEHLRCQTRWAAQLASPQETHRVGALPELWRLIDLALDKHGMPVSDPVGFRVLAGRPGDLFGTPDARGRWVEAEHAPTGRWCAMRRCYGEHHWRGGVVEVQDGSLRRWLELYDRDELWWAHLSRAARVGPREVYSLDGDEIRLATVLPRQLRRLGALGRRDGWRWTRPDQGETLRLLEGAGLQALSR